jgi:hypothetical protein
MFPMDRKAKRLIAVWYDSHGRRRFKVFDDPYAARTKLATTLVSPFPACVAGPVGHIFTTDVGKCGLPDYPHADPAL